MGKKSKKKVRLQQATPIRPPIIPTPWVPYLILAVIILLFSFIRIRLASFPLERDEGEYAYLGQLILNGIPPYQLAYNLKFPGIYAVYALIMAIFGQTAEGIRYGMLLFNTGSLFFIFFIMKRLFSSLSALAATAVASILFSSPNLLGQAAHATHFVTFFMLVGVWLLLEAIDKRRWLVFFLSGVMMGLSLLMKQSAIFFSFFGSMFLVACLWLRKEKRWAGLLVPLIPYGLGVAIPLLLTLLIMYLCGVFDKFWFWTFIYPKVYSDRVPISLTWTSFIINFKPILYSYPAVWILSTLGVISLFLYRGKMSERLFLGLLLIFSFLSTIPGIYFRPHYFIPTAPAVGMLAGFFLEFLDQRIGHAFRPLRWALSLTTTVLVINILIGNKTFYFQGDPDQLCHILYSDNNFTEAVPVAKFLQANSGADDRIFVFGSEPEIYFYAKRKSATSYIYMYDLAFSHPYKQRMQKDLINEVEKSKPKFIVTVSSPLSWLDQPGELDDLFAWLNAYTRQNKYIPVGLVNYKFPEPSEILWGKDFLAAKPSSPNDMVILQRQQ
jgi:hypothetical protein